MALWQLAFDGERRLARGPAGEGPQELLEASLTLDALLAVPDALATELRGPSAGPVPAGARIVAPIGSQEVWAAGVTYTRSRDARVLESGTPDHYERVYLAERPELFLKATPGRARGPGEPVGIREDSGWDVPEPELAVVADSAGHIVGYLNGNDMSSRSIEGENPLYLPQAKIYTGSCALGPCLATPDEVPGLASLLIACGWSGTAPRCSATRSRWPTCAAAPATWCGGSSVRSTSRWAWCCSPGPRSSRHRTSPCASGTK